VNSLGAALRDASTVAERAAVMCQYAGLAAAGSDAAIVSLSRAVGPPFGPLS